ncbi:MAG: arginine repressor [Clostridia bacterium]|nr:arginine repressor [Clostridia bacterium]
MAKKSRRLRIVSLINEYEINTQEELVSYLNNEGYNTTQATVSRDIKILGLQKVKGVTKNFKYAMPPETEKSAVTQDKVITLLKTFIVSIERAKNLVVIKTLEGNGSACGMAVDKIGMKEIIGSIAGDDTLLIVTHTDEDAQKTVEHFKKLVDL